MPPKTGATRAPMELTPAEMDDIIAKLEACLSKVDLAQGSRVRLMKAETDILTQIERARDFMEAVLRDRAALKAVFGAEAKAEGEEGKADAGWGSKTEEELAAEEKARRRHSRVRAILESVKLSGQNSEDKRLPSCLYVVDSIDKLLEATQGSQRVMVVKEKMRLSKSRSSLHGDAKGMAGALKGVMAAKRFAKKIREDPVPKIIACEDLDELQKMEPSKKNALGTWMIWMVHRAHLNDPSLTKFDFTNCQMPASYEMGRAQHVAPKLVKAIAWNTHIERLLLPYTNLRGPEGRELGLSLQTNNSIRFLDIDSNMLAVEDVEILLQNMADNHNICELRLNNQIPGNAGQTRNGAMEALLTYSQKSSNLVKLGMNITEPHFANEISRSIMRNNDAARQARKTTAEQLAKEEAEERARERERLEAEEEEERLKEEEKLAMMAAGGAIPSGSESESEEEEGEEEEGEDDSENDDEGEEQDGPDVLASISEDGPADPDVRASISADAAPLPADEEGEAAGGSAEPKDEPVAAEADVLASALALPANGEGNAGSRRKKKRGVTFEGDEIEGAAAAGASAAAEAHFDPPPRVVAAEAAESAERAQPVGEAPAEPEATPPEVPAEAAESAEPAQPAAEAPADPEATPPEVAAEAAESAEPAQPAAEAPAEPEATPPEEPVVEPPADLGKKKFLWLLEHRPTLKAKVQQYHSENAQNGLLDLVGLRSFCAEVESEFDVPPSAFGNIEDDLARFDFDGSGALDFNEAYKCVKACLFEYRKSIGEAPKPDVPFKTPVEAGYTVIRVLASGGQGSASLATDSNGDEVVLKTYSRENENAGGLEELMDEAEHMRMVNKHDHVAHCFSIFQDKENLYMISGANFGGDWASIQKSASEQEGVALSEDWYRTLFRQAFEGLLHMHAHAVMHCDIKEPNLMLKGRDFSISGLNVVIIDLGLSHTYPSEQDICGTPGYIPPETWNSGKWFPKGDVFCMGVVMLQLLLKKIPKEEGDVRGIFTEDCQSLDDVQTNTRDVQPPIDQAQTETGPASTELQELIRHCLEKERGDRPRVPQALAQEWFEG